MLESIGNLAYMGMRHVALTGWNESLYNVTINTETFLSFTPFLTVDQSCDTTLQWVNQRLAEAGLRTVQTFDLQDARAGARDCTCPQHGTGQCDCQMVVLLIYGNGKEPETLILHGRDGKTWLSFAHTIQHTSGLADRIQKALDTIEPAS